MLEGLAIVSGLSAIDPAEGVASFARGPYPLAGDIGLNGHYMSRLDAHRHFIEQRYDFSCGELDSRFRFSVDGATATCDVLTFCSRSFPTVVLQRLRIRVESQCRLAVRSGLEIAGLTGAMVERNVTRASDDAPLGDGALLWETYGGHARCGAAYVTHFDGGDGVDVKRDENDRAAPLMTEYTVSARPGREYVLDQLACLLPSSFHSEPNKQASRIVNVAAHRGFDRLRRENHQAWDDLWPSRPIIHAADVRWQELADAAFYYMHSSAHSSSLFSTGMFGLAYWPNYHYYRGHVMWDIEMFAFPSILIAAPATARSMLHYRFQRLAAAQQNAALQGYLGVQFPWESSPELGEEVTPLHGRMLGLEEHVNFSVALAFAHFVNVTGDAQFLHEQAWPVLRGVADWIASRSTCTPRGYEITDALGIAEGRPAPVDNDAYVNMAAAVTLQEAIAAGEQLHHDTRAWQEIARRLVIPVDDASRTIKNHDDFTPSEGGQIGATPEALAGFFPAGYRCDPALMERTIRFYLGRVDPYIGSPMLSAPLGVYAAWIGDRALSARLFTEGYAEFIDEPFRATNEFSNVRMPDKPRAGPLFANIGGFLSSLYFGLPRWRISAEPLERWAEGPVTMPAGWDGIEVERIWVRGRPARLLAEHGSETRLIYAD